MATRPYNPPELCSALLNTPEPWLPHTSIRVVVPIPTVWVPFLNSVCVPSQSRPQVVVGPAEAHGNPGHSLPTLLWVNSLSTFHFSAMRPLFQLYQYSLPSILQTAVYSTCTSSRIPSFDHAEDLKTIHFPPPSLKHWDATGVVEPSAMQSSAKLTPSLSLSDEGGADFRIFVMSSASESL
jgi:hypothetical protein